MTRIVFTVSGNKVQDVGYGLFLLQAMKERGLIGYATNLASGKQVNIVAWGNRIELEDFYDFLLTKKPGFVGKIALSQKIIDAVPKPSGFELLNEKMDLMIEQTGRFAQEGISIGKTLKKIPKEIARELKA